MLECFCLRNRAGEAIKDNSFARTKCIISCSKDINHQRVGDELTFVNKALSSFAQLRTILDFSTKYVTCRDVLEAVLLNEQVALRTLTRTRCAEDNDILHLGSCLV
ncbi:hypothetical protein EVA_20368 [gut metagenome]|uniref:Uncharacterized protein n=1 Tax=gut metagenome TaxID=749906 RepID=J9F9D2_9ZZZZ